MDQKTQFYELFEEHFSKQNDKFKDMGFISQEKYEKIVETLNCGKGKKSDSGANFKLNKLNLLNKRFYAKSQLLTDLKHN